MYYILTTFLTMLTGRRKTRTTLLRNWRALPRFVNKLLPYMHYQAMTVSFNPKPDANFFKMLTGMAEGPIPGMQVLRWGDTLEWKFSPKEDGGRTCSSFLCSGCLWLKRRHCPSLLLMSSSTLSRWSHQLIWSVFARFACNKAWKYYFVLIVDKIW